MILNRLTDRAKEVLLNASTNGKSTTARRIMHTIQESGGVGTYLLRNNPGLKIKTTATVQLNDLVEKAFYFSASLKHLYVGTEHLLVALLDISASPDVSELTTQISKMNTFPNVNVQKEFDNASPILDTFGVNLNEKISRHKLTNPIYREESDQLVAALIRKEKPNALIVGESGVGKKSLVEILVSKINNYDVPVSLAGYMVIEFDIMSFIANLSSKEGLDTGLAALLEDIENCGDVILYIKDFQNLFIGTGSGFAIPLVFSLLRNYLETSGVSIIGVVDSGFYTKLDSENAQILNDFEIIQLGEPEDPKILEILKAKSKELSVFHGVEIKNDVLNYVFDKSDKLKFSSYPNKAIKLLDHACSLLLLRKDLVPSKYKDLVDEKAEVKTRIEAFLNTSDFESASKMQKKLNDVDNRLEKMRVLLETNSKLILTVADVDVALKDLEVSDFEEGDVDLEHLSNLTDEIKKKIIGQDKAIEIVTKALIRGKLGLRSRKRPLGNFLFLGPTGVGKTELAKVLSESAFDEDSLIRLDMSDFAEKHTVSRLVGAPPGYVGYGEGGELTSKIETNPDSLVLFDEIEKAHPDVLNILLQIMEEGELSDAKGNTFDFSKSVIVLTSNLGTDIVLKKDIGFVEGSKSDESVEGRLRENLKKIMKPELLNRFDEIIVFKKLNRIEQRKILDLLLREIIETLEKQDVKLKIYADAKKYLLGKGYSDEYGARALRRVVESELLDKIAEFLLTHKKRPLKISVSCEDSGLVISNQK